MRITEILKKIWLFSANKRKSSESISKQPTQLIIAAHNCHIYFLQTVKIHYSCFINILFHQEQVREWHVINAIPTIIQTQIAMIQSTLHIWNWKIIAKFLNRTTLVHSRLLFASKLLEKVRTFTY